MPKSSKTSWEQSQSQAKPGKQKSAPKPTSKPGSLHAQSLAEQQAAAALQQKAKKPFLFTIPVGEEYKLQIPRRLFPCLGLSFCLYWLAGLVANDWLYLLSSGFLIAAVMGVLFPYLQLSEVEIEGSLPHEVVVSETARCYVRMTRRFTLGPLSMLLPLHSVRLTVGLVRLSGPQRTAERIVSLEPVLIDMMGNELVLDYMTPALRRGIYQLDKIELTSGFPFSLGWWTRIVDVNQNRVARNLQITVYPRSAPIPGTFLARLPGLTSYMGLSTSTSRLIHQSTSVRGVREFRTGDAMRHIHWPSSARLGTLMVREFDSEMLPAFNVMLDLKANWKTAEQFELAVLMALSLTELGHRLGSMPNFVINPALDSTELGKMMSDLPQIPHGIEFISEILARVEPINVAETRSDAAGFNPLIEEYAKGVMPLIGLFPHPEPIMVSTPTGDRLVSPVELAHITGVHEKDIFFGESAERKVQFKAARQQRPDASRLRTQYEMETEIIALITDERELIAL